MTHRRIWLWMAVAAVVAALGCGGGQKAAEPDDTADPYEPEDEDDEDVLIPEVKFEEIRTTFERKVNYVSRCFPEAVEAGELSPKDRVTVTVGLTIQTDGTPENVRILERSKRSEALESCIVRTVGRWLFTELPKPLDTSHIYTVQNF